MTPERYKEVGQLYRAALEVEPERRVAFLVEACSGDETLRQEVESLLDYATRSGGLIDQPALDVAAKEIAEGQPWFPVGQSLGHYRILSLLGKGGMGEVYRARDTKLDRTVALKLLPAELAANQDRMRRFVREAKAASALNHPHVATIYEIGEAGGVSFIAMEYVEGQTLAAEINGCPLDAAKVIEIGVQVADALDEAHSKGITHRDIKPANLMLTPRGRVKVLDFGLAKVAHPAGQDELSQFHAQSQTTPGVVMGTVAYMSPEQALGREVDHRSDIFSLGVALYEMATGQRPFRGATASETIDHILHSEPEPLAQVNEQAPAGLAQIVSKCLAKEREQRYQSARDLLTDLDQLKSGRLSVTRALPTASTAPTPRARAGKTAALSATLLSLVALAGGLLAYRSFAPSSQAIDSLAVLPFQNRSGNADSEYLSDGLAETLIYQLSQLPNLKVSPTSSVFRYKGKDTDPLKVGAELGVQAVMSGRMTQRGEQLTISVELVDVRHNKTLWGEQYERKLSELLTTQRDIAAEITHKLQLKLSGEGAQKLTRNYTDNPEAYQLYLKGRYYWNKRTEENLRKAIEQFKAAADLDPNYALAYAGLADCYSLLPNYSNAPSNEFLPQARAYAERAIAIDDSLGEAHISLAWADTRLWNWAEAEKEFKRGLELSPNYATGHQWYGQYLMIQGHSDEALTENKRAQELEPLSLSISLNVAQVYLAKGDADSAVEQLKRVIDLDPNWPNTHQQLAMIYVKQGRNAEALAEAEKAVELSKRQSVALGAFGYVLAQRGKRSEALQVAEELKARFTKRQAKGIEIGWIYLGLKEKDETFRWLEKNFENSDRTMALRLALYPLNSLRDEARYKDLRKRMKLPE